MDKTAMPANISYTLLVHAGSYKDFVKKMERDYPDLEIKATKQKAVHYYLVLVSENGNTDYKKEQIYKLPIMAMREEFSNYIFFKSVKAYNNVLKLMYNGKEDNNAPYNLFIDMLTPIEKYKFGEVNNETKSISYTEQINEKASMKTSVFGEQIFNISTLANVYIGNDLIVDDKEIDFVELIKKQNLRIGII